MNTSSLRKVLAVVLALGSTACQYGPSPFAEKSTQNRLQVETKAPGILKRYNSFYIADIGVYAVEGDHLRRVEDREVQMLAEEFRAKLIRNLGSRHSPIPQRTRDTALISVAITDVSTTYAAFQLLPGSIVPNALRGGASIEATIVDSVSNEEIAHMRDSRQGARQGFLSGLGKWDGVKRAFDEWAQMLAQAIRK